MKTAAEIEAELSLAAGRLRALSIAAKDQAAKATPEPNEPTRNLQGALFNTPAPTVPNR